jgi:hypothetical protein
MHTYNLSKFTMRPSNRILILSLFCIPAKYFWVYGFCFEISKGTLISWIWQAVGTILVFLIYNIVFEWDYKWRNQKEGGKISIFKLRIKYPPPPPPAKNENNPLLIPAEKYWTEEANK